MELREVFENVKSGRAVLITGSGAHMKAMETRQKYMTVPAAIHELEKIETVRRNGRSFKLDHAVTKTQKIILSSFGLDEDSVRNSVEEISKLLATSLS